MEGKLDCVAWGSTRNWRLVQSSSGLGVVFLWTLAMLRRLLLQFACLIDELGCNGISTMGIRLRRLRGLSTLHDVAWVDAEVGCEYELSPMFLGVIKRLSLLQEADEKKVRRSEV